MQPLDWIVITIYFGIIGYVAWWYGRHQKDTTDYFLAGRNAGWVVIGASIFTSNIGSEHIVGLAGQGASTGMAMAHWELHAWCLIVLAGLFVPFYYNQGGAWSTDGQSGAFPAQKPAEGKIFIVYKGPGPMGNRSGPRTPAPRTLASCRCTHPPRNRPDPHIRPACRRRGPF